MLSTLRIDPQAATPIYLQLVQQIAQCIASGEWRSGDEVPSVRMVAQRFGINPMTISKAYSELARQGWLMAQRGKPMRVADCPPEEAKQLLQTDLHQLVYTAKRLGIDLQTVQAELAKRWEEQDDRD
ncbi:MAG: GntR family transcriptional regulator [Gammaproteobacteria bacterium]|nr:GntR family transcriptional regulator [Gammaproteobacteria bacterium]